MTQNNFKILKFFKISKGTKILGNPHILRTLAIFLVFYRSKFFAGFFKELEVHTVFIDDY